MRLPDHIYAALSTTHCFHTGQHRLSYSPSIVHSAHVAAPLIIAFAAHTSPCAKPESLQAYIQAAGSSHDVVKRKLPFTSTSQYKYFFGNAHAHTRACKATHKQRVLVMTLLNENFVLQVQASASIALETQAHIHLGLTLQIAAHRSQPTSHLYLTLATFHEWQVVVHIQLLIVHLSRFAASSSYLSSVVHNAPFPYLPAQPILQPVHCSQCALVLTLDNSHSHCRRLLAPHQKSSKVTHKQRVPLMTLTNDTFGSQVKDSTQVLFWMRACTYTSLQSYTQTAGSPHDVAHDIIDSSLRKVHINTEERCKPNIQTHISIQPLTDTYTHV